MGNPQRDSSSVGTRVKKMAAKESPLSELAETNGVRVVCVLGPDGRILSCVWGREEGSGWIEFLQAWSGHPCLSRPELKEVALFYPNSLVVWRRIEGAKNPGEGSSQSVQGPYRHVMLVADPASSLSLLRVSLDVQEHGWRALGIEKVFPLSGEKGSEGGLLSKLFRRPSR